MKSGVYRGVQRGIVQFYHAANIPVVPVVLDSGKYWPCKQLNITPGVIKVMFMPEIPAGLSKNEMLSRLEESFVTGLKEIGNYKEVEQVEHGERVEINSIAEGHHDGDDGSSKRNKRQKSAKKHANKPVKHTEDEETHESDNA